MKQFQLTLILLLLGANITTAQLCTGLHIFLSSQEDVDNFIIDYPDCDQLNGFVLIGADHPDSTDITNLDGLVNITTIQGHLTIQNIDGLTDLSGLKDILRSGTVVNIFIPERLTKFSFE